MREAIEQILMDARSIEYTGNQQIDSYVDSIIKTAIKALASLEGGDKVANDK